MTFTELELIALKSITESDFYSSGKQSQPWNFSVYDACPFKGKKRSGVFSSLVQKGAIIVTENEKKFNTINGIKTRNPYWSEASYGVIFITEDGYTALADMQLINEDGYFI